MPARIRQVMAFLIHRDKHDVRARSKQLACSSPPTVIPYRARTFPFFFSRQLPPAGVAVHGSTLATTDNPLPCRGQFCSNATSFDNLTALHLPYFQHPTNYLLKSDIISPTQCFLNGPSCPLNFETSSHGQVSGVLLL
jgi:hypothetical protein